MLLDINNHEVIATSCRSLLVYTKVYGTCRRILYRLQEYVLVLLNGQQQVIEITEFISVPVSAGNRYHTFVKGNLYTLPDDRQIHMHSGNCFVTPTSEEVIIYSYKVLRKVMLYPDPDNIDSPTCYVVIDYNKPNLSISADDVVVPIYPKVGDMLEVAGDDNGIWFGHVNSVDVASRTCRVKFYVSDESDLRKYRPEVMGRRVYEVVDWASILRVANGYWDGNFWYITPSSS